MEMIEEVVIVGGGIAGLATALGLHRNGVNVLVLESSTALRVTGFAFATWTNGWKALDAMGIASELRENHVLLHGLSVYPSQSDQAGEELSFYTSKGKTPGHEVRCVRRKMLLEALTKELPDGAIRFSAKLVSLEDSGYFKRLHLSDGSVIKAKTLIGCDGINSVVARSLGFKKLAFSRRFAVRGYAEFTESHNLEHKFHLFLGRGVRIGLIPCDDKFVYWFLTCTSDGSFAEEEEDQRSPIELKQFVLNHAEGLPEHVKTILEATNLHSIQSVPLHYRPPWQILWGNISKGNACVAGDALHPMTPDIGQGACTALEDGVVLARCLSSALRRNGSTATEGEEYERIEAALKNYGRERRWRSFSVACTALVVGAIQQSDNKVVSFVRGKLMLKYLSSLLLKRSEYDCGKLVS